MKKKILLPVLLLFGLISFSQKSSQMYAITSSDNNLQWFNIRLVDVAKGKIVKTVFDYNDFQKVQMINAASNIPLLRKADNGGPTESMVAAASYDGVHHQLFFIPMKIAELRWVDLTNSSSPGFYTLQSPVLSKLNMNDIANQFTRMVVGKNNYGYALTNDANHLIRFTTGKMPVITDLGNLVDASANGTLSVHNACSSWGGDLVAATDGQLYLISNNNQVFQFTPDERIAKHLGQIKGLPDRFTTNGAAVLADGTVIVGCSIGYNPLYKVDLFSLTAEPAFPEFIQNTNISDLASSNLMFRAAQNNGTYIESKLPLSEGKDQHISVFPNPVTENNFQLSFQDAEKRNYTIQVLDLTGKILLNKIVNINGSAQFIEVEMRPVFAKGLYMVKVLSHQKKTVYSSKLMLQ